MNSTSMNYIELFKQYETELSAVKDKYRPLLLAAKEELLLAANEEIALHCTWDVIKEEDRYCIYNSRLELINSEYSMPIEHKTHIQITTIATLKSRLLNTALTVEDVNGKYYIVTCYKYGIIIHVRNNVFKIKYDSRDSGSFEYTISKKNLCDILEKLTEICS